MSRESLEQRTARVLGRILGATVVPRDVAGAPPGTHDLDVILSDGRTIAVEVTTSADQQALGFWAAVHKTAWDTQLQHAWLLNVVPSVSVKRLRGSVETLLRGLEQAGIPQFGLRNGQNTPEVAELHRLGVKSGGILPGAPARIYISSTGAGAVGIDVVRDAVEREALKPDNRDKLGRVVADERHLFVWIDPLNTLPAAAAGFMEVALPSGCTLPPGIDAVWVATPALNDDGTDGERVWRYACQYGWQRVTHG